MTNNDMGKRLEDFVKIRELLDRKEILKATKTDEIERSLEEIDSKYEDSFYEIDKELDNYSELLKERKDNISTYSKFDRKTIISALKYILEEIYDIEFQYEYADSIRRDDGFPIATNGGGILAPKGSFYTNLPMAGGEVRAFYYIKNSNDIIVFYNTMAPLITEEYITFYGEDGKKLIYSKNYDCVYNFIDCLVDYRWISKREEISENEIMNRATQFVENYKSKEKGKVYKK